MPPSSLHPRSLTTTSLFSTTLAVAFLVVAAPHIIPCPRPRNGIRADEGDEDVESIQKVMSEDGQMRRRKRRRRLPEEGRRCPMPRPRGGLVEEIRKWREGRGNEKEREVVEGWGTWLGWGRRERGEGWGGRRVMIVESTRRKGSHVEGKAVPVSTEGVER